MVQSLEKKGARKKKLPGKKLKKINKPNGSRVALVCGSALVALSQERPERNEREHGAQGPERMLTYADVC